MYKRSFEGWVKHWDFIIIDAICLQISFILAYYLRYQSFFSYGSRNPYRTSGLVLLLLSVIVAIAFNTMHNVLTRSLWEEIKSTFWQCAFVFAGIVLLLFSDKSSNRVSRIVLYLTMTLYGVSSIITRYIYKKIFIAHKKVKNKRVMLLVGDEKGIERAQVAFAAHPEEGVNVKSIVRVDGKGDVELNDAADYICNEWIDEVYIACSDLKLIPTNLIIACSEMAVTVHQQLFMADDVNDHPWVGKIAKQPVLTTSINIPRPAELIFKRCVDVVAGIFLSILSLIVLIISTPLIKLVSPGPVLLKLERIGQNGKKFMMYTIRTMYMDAVEREDKVVKGIGTFLRRWSLDQLPKGFNVLMGQMSLVGTRAPSVTEWEGYQYHHRARLACKPGITGLFQVCGGGKVMTFEEATEIDTEYIANWSTGLDWRILLTPSVLRKRYAGRLNGGIR